jgi:hypothetical protein
MKEVVKLFVVIQVLALLVCACIKPNEAVADTSTKSTVNKVTLTTQSVVAIDDVFGEYLTTVDENIYYSLASVNSQTLKEIYGDKNTAMYKMALETINPCMALATMWGEIDSDYKGISLTNVMDFNPATYNKEIDWITLTKNLEQVDSAWYMANTESNYNTNEDGKCYRIPVALLQSPRSGSRVTSAMTGLGVGPFQITTYDWDESHLDNRVNPIWSYTTSLRQYSTTWINCGIDPISDITVYACWALAQQGCALITYDFGKKLINVINRQDVQDAIYQVGYQMFVDAREKAYNREITLDDINVKTYVTQLENITGIDFSSYHGGVGRTNKGNYTISHVLRYIFYKYYYTSGL